MFNPKNLSINIDLVKDDGFDAQNITVSILRLDAIHPVVSGNKIFKLYYFLTEAKKCIHKKIITFGGAYSNHLAATAVACRQAGLQSVGIVRGEKTEKLSHTLLYCTENDMQLEFISRHLFKEMNELKNPRREEFQEQLRNKYGDHILIPEGGSSAKGVQGAGMICSYFDAKKFTHVCCAVGTATTLAGIINATKDETVIVGFSALKNLHDVTDRLQLLGVSSSKKYSIINDYHFGGYAKKNMELISFINSFYNNNKIPLDFVYTGKMMFGLCDLIKKKYFKANAKILCIHTGGLQGNKSLPDGLLNF